MNSCFPPKWMSFPEHHKARAPLIGPRHVGIITKAMSPREAQIYALGTFEPHGGGGKNDVILERPEAIRTKGVGVMRHHHPFKNLVQCVSPFVCGLFRDLLSPFFFFFSFLFWGPWPLWKTLKYSLATRMFWDRGTHDSLSLKDRMHILRSTSMISKFEVLICGPPHYFTFVHIQCTWPTYETNMDKVMVCDLFRLLSMFIIFPILLFLFWQWVCVIHGLITLLSNYTRKVGHTKVDERELLDMSTSLIHPC